MKREEFLKWFAKKQWRLIGSRGYIRSKPQGSCPLQVLTGSVTGYFQASRVRFDMASRLGLAIVRAADGHPGKLRTQMLRLAAPMKNRKAPA